MQDKATILSLSFDIFRAQARYETSRAIDGYTGYASSPLAYCACLTSASQYAPFTKRIGILLCCLGHISAEYNPPPEKAAFLIRLYSQANAFKIFECSAESSSQPAQARYPDGMLPRHQE